MSDKEIKTKRRKAIWSDCGESAIVVVLKHGRKRLQMYVKRYTATA